MTIGFIYIVRNPSHETDVYKVGKTSRTIDERLKELNSETSNIGKFDLIKSFLVNDIDRAEIECHKNLDSMRVQNNREFFKSNLSNLEDEVSRVCVKYLVENNNHARNTNLEDLASKLFKNIEELRLTLDNFDPTLKTNNESMASMGSRGIWAKHLRSFQISEKEIRRLLAVDLELKIGKISS